MNLKSSPLPLITDRLVLRAFVPADFTAYAAYHTLPELYRYLYTAPLSVPEIQKKFDSIVGAPFENDGDAFRVAVISRNDDALVGDVSLKLASRDALQGEIGYIFNPQFSGKGYATEAVKTVMNVGFIEFGFHRIFARLDVDNKGSVGVVERLGLRREAHLIQNDRFNDVWGDEYVYAALASEWQDMCARTARS
ncbi:GNAT family N-acetyltransferase [Phyllobacterium sp. YR531]|uniref:GNAT family N-acetyltransferase n=1 Tax=Phyllobacterium sp. YR531 TaxID=1144343 RepID=UPI00026F4959|nr:GNAT family N-acetyltransferase [Phyllobacterium sp. YR531]EJN04943.1 acetyltransferase, ribosomal protein N-acetylase [Phyllobacterium sp. YR531]